MAFSNTLHQLVEMVGSIFKGVLSNFILAVTIILIGFIMGRIIGRIIRRFLHEVEVDALFRRTTKFKISIEEILSGLASFFVYFVTVIMALNQLGLTTTILYIISAGVVVLIILSIFLSVKDFIPNLIAGIFIHEKRNVKKGDYIQFKDIGGKIIDINLVETKIETNRGDLLFIPNAHLMKTEFIKRKGKKG